MAVEQEVGLRVGDDEVEAEIDAPEGEEETCELVLIWGGKSRYSTRSGQI